MSDSATTEVPEIMGTQMNPDEIEKYCQVLSEIPARIKRLLWRFAGEDRVGGASVTFALHPVSEFGYVLFTWRIKIGYMDLRHRFFGFLSEVAALAETPDVEIIWLPEPQGGEVLRMGISVYGETVTTPLEAQERVVRLLEAAEARMCA